MLALQNILIVVENFKPDPGLFKILSNFPAILKGENLNIIYRIFLQKPDNISELKVPQELELEVEKAFISNLNSAFSLTLEVVPSSGEVVINILKDISQNNIDLLITNFSKKNRELAIKFTRCCACSVLLLSPEHSGNIDKILVPIDFSTYSKVALKTSLLFAEGRKTKLFINHIYYVPEGYHSSGKSYNEMAGLVKINAKKEYQKLSKELNLMDHNISTSFILDDDKDPTDKIYKEALDLQVDLIIMFSKGNTSSGSEIMGNTAKTILMYNETIPLLILKNKQENADIADYIWKTGSIK